MQRLNLISVLMMLLVFACSKGGGSSSSEQSRVPPPQNEDAINQILNHQRIDCASINGGACPRGIVRVMRFLPSETSLCSGFMIGIDLVMTNHHCISTQEHCDNSYFIVYDGPNYYVLRCDSILHTELDDQNTENRKIDYSVLKTKDPYPGHTFTPDNNPTTFGDAITVWAVDQTGNDMSPPNLLDSRVTEFKCKVGEDPNSPSLTLDNCPITGGNSGSPALSQGGGVIGIVWGQAPGTLINTLMPLDERRALPGRKGSVTETQYIHY